MITLSGIPVTGEAINALPAEWQEVFNEEKKGNELTHLAFLSKAFAAIKNFFLTLLHYIIPESWFLAWKLKTHAEIPILMDDMFSQHVEKKEILPHIVRRMVKNYFEQFDPLHTYLLDKEVNHFVDFEGKGYPQAEKLAEEMKKGNFAYFDALDKCLMNSIKRAQKIRSKLFATMDPKECESLLSQEKSQLEGVPQKLADKILLYSDSASFPRNQKELENRIKRILALFYLAHQIKDPKSKDIEIAKLFALKKRIFRDKESLLLGFDHLTNPLSKARALTPAEKRSHQVYRIMRAFAKSLDPHSSFFTPEGAKSFNQLMSMKREMYGFTLCDGPEGLYIGNIEENSPASKAKIAKGDRVLQINGSPTEGLSRKEGRTLLQLDTHQSVTLRVENENKEIKEVTLSKEVVESRTKRLKSSHESFGDGIIGQITFDSFYKDGKISASQDFKDAIEAMKKKGEIRGLIIDLRENLGGNALVATEIASHFISSGILSQQPGYTQSLGSCTFRTHKEKATYTFPLLILISKSSASGSEALAKICQDYGVAVVMGDNRSFGKGTSQFPSIKEESSAYKITRSRYHTVSGETPQKVGVASDIPFPSHYAPFPIGEEHLPYCLSPKKLPETFDDSMKDIMVKPFQKHWQSFDIHKQSKNTFWSQVIPKLKENSQMRREQSERFQKYQKIQEKITTYVAENSYANMNDLNLPADIYGEGDLLMDEAKTIIKEMIQEESLEKAITQK